MRASATALPHADSARALPYARWLALACLLAAELLAVTWWFDTQELMRDRHWWSDLVGHWPLANQLFLAALAAALVFGGTRLRDELLTIAHRLHLPPRGWLYLPAHIAALVGTSLLTGFILDGGLRAANYPFAWILAWLLSIGLTLALLVAVAIPPALWSTLLRRALPLAILGLSVGVLACLAGFGATTLWLPLARLTLRSVAALLAILVNDPLCIPARFLVGTAAFHVEIAPECSGYEGIGLACAFLSIYLCLYRHTLRFPHALLLVPIGALIIWIMNVLRITILILIGTWISPTIALGSFHSLAGWLAFIGVSLGLVVIARRSRLFAAPSAEISEISGPSAASTPNPYVPYLAPVVVLLATGLITGSIFQSFDPLYGLAVVTTGAMIWRCRHVYAAWPWRLSFTPVCIGILTYGAWILLSASPTELTSSNALRDTLSQAPLWASALWIIFRILGAVVIVPLAEELVFRGFLARRLIASDFAQVPLGQFTWFSCLLSSVLFGAMHHSLLAGTVAGIGFALALYHRRRLPDAVVAHATTNALICIQVLLRGDWWLWT